MDTILRPGKEFERSNQIAALAQSHDSPTAGMQRAITCNINLNRSITDQSDPRFVSEQQWRRALTEPRKRSKFIFPRRGWGLGTRLYLRPRLALAPLVTVLFRLPGRRLSISRSDSDATVAYHVIYITTIL